MSAAHHLDHLVLESDSGWEGVFQTCRRDAGAVPGAGAFVFTSWKSFLFNAFGSAAR